LPSFPSAFIGNIFT